MATTTRYINQAQKDRYDNIWIVGRDLVKFDGTFTYFDSNNSSLPGYPPYYLDTRSISIDPSDNKWIGCATLDTLNSPLIIKTSGDNCETTEFWLAPDITGATGNLDVPTVYASPYGEECLAFIAPLNGAGGTGAAAATSISGGRLFTYEDKIGKWYENAPGFEWPHIYDIKSRGISGNDFEYFLATEDGIYIIPTGNLSVSNLEDGAPYVQQASFLNSLNSSLPSDVIYSLDFDENGNLWIGTDGGLVFWDFSKMTVWDSSVIAIPNDTIYSVESRKNGHIFFTCGNPNDGSGTGFYHFNGYTLSEYNSVNASLPDDQVLGLIVVEKTAYKGNVFIPENSIWAITGNDITSFQYTIPHIKATSLYEGASGWNFINYESATGGYEYDVDLPRANKYSWEYPTWRNYQDSDLQYKFPGLDSRNLFLDVDLKDIASGEAGKQEYWNNGEIPTYSDSVRTSEFEYSDWIKGITGGSIVVTCSTIIGDKYVIGGYTNRTRIYFGKKNGVEDVEIISGSAFGSNYGFIAWYNKGGEVQGAIGLRGQQSIISDIKPSSDHKSLFILGSFYRFIEIGKFVWTADYIPATVTTPVTPEGAPVGFSNIQTPGITAAPYEYDWIYDGTGVLPVSGRYIKNTSLIPGDGDACFILEVDSSIGGEFSYGGIDFSTSNAQREYKVKNFRYFPSTYSTSFPFGGLVASTALKLYPSKNDVSLVFSYFGDLDTLKNKWGRNDDLLSTDEYISSSSSNFAGFWISLGKQFELLKTRYIVDNNYDVFFRTISSSPDSNYYLLGGVTESTSLNIGGKEISGGAIGQRNPFYFISDYYFNIIGGNIINSGTLSPVGYEITSSEYNGSFYIGSPYAGTGSVSTYSYSTFDDELPGVSTVKMTHSGEIQKVDSFDLFPAGSLSNVFLTSMNITPEGYRYYGSSVFGASEYYMTVSKTPDAGFVSDYIQIESESGTNTIFTDFDDLGNVFISGSARLSATGPEKFPIEPLSGITKPYTGIIPQYLFKPGKDMGNIVSRAGIGAFKWYDVHNTENGELVIPPMTTVFFSNNGSLLFGKNENRWVLSDDKTGEIILDVKQIPYFIYTFNNTGRYTIVNSVEDSIGNLYEKSIPGMIRVENASVPKEDDANPEFVNSADYGYPNPGPSQESYPNRISKELLKEQKELMDAYKKKSETGSGLLLDDDSNQTFAGN